MITKYDNKKVRYPIKRIEIPNLGEIRYWLDREGKYHVALWDTEECLVTDKDNPIADFLRVITKMLVEGKDFPNTFSELYKAYLLYRDKYLEVVKELKKVRKQRNYYSRTLKKKNQEIKKLENYIEDGYKVRAQYIDEF